MAPEKVTPGMRIPRNNKWIIINRKKYSLNYFLAKNGS
jgi:hypothetical protein